MNENRSKVSQFCHYASHLQSNTWVFFATLSCLIIYYFTLNFPFQFDDLANITKNFSIRHAFRLSERFFLHSRWLVEVINSINFAFADFQPAYFRIFNVLLHLVNGGLMYYCLKHLLTSHVSASNAWCSRAVAALASGIFLLHPAQSQTVNYVTQMRMEGLVFLSCMLSLVTFIKFVQSRNYLTFISYALLITIGLSCKEIAICIPGLLILTDWAFYSQSNWNAWRKNLAFHLFGIVVSLTVFLLLFKMDFLIKILQIKTTAVNNRGSILTENPYEPISAYRFLLSQFQVIWHYLAIFVWPPRLCVEYSFKLQSSFSQPAAFLPFLALLLASVGALTNLWFSKNKIVGFSFIWFLFTMLPRASIIASAELAADYKTYLASFGICLLFAFAAIGLAQFLHEKLAWSAPATRNGITALLFVVLSAGTWQRNQVWKDCVAFWSDIVEKNPEKARSHNNLGVALTELGNYQEAIGYYVKATQLDKLYPDAWSNLAVAYSVLNQNQEAIQSLQEAIKITPNYPEAYNNLAALHLKQNQLEPCKELLDKAIALKPHYGKAYFNLARYYAAQNDLGNAWQNFKKATETDMDTKEGFFLLGQASIMCEKYDQAVQAFQKALQKGDQSADCYAFLANAYFLNKQYEQAANLYNQLSNSLPQEDQFRHNLAESLIQLEHFDQAESILESLVQKHSNIGSSYLRLAFLKEKRHDYDKAMAVLQDNENLFSQCEEHLAILNQELGRLKLQKKIHENDGKINMHDLQECLA